MDRVLSEHRPLQRKVFAINAALFAGAVATLALAPVTINRVTTPREFVMLSAALVLLLGLDLLLLRRAFGSVDAVRADQRELVNRPAPPTVIEGLAVHADSAPFVRVQGLGDELVSVEVSSSPLELESQGVRALIDALRSAVSAEAV